MITDDEETLLAELPQHPAWSGLRKLMAERKKLEFDRMSSALIRGDELTAEDIAYKRGYFDGLTYIFNEVQRTRARSEVSG